MVHFTQYGPAGLFYSSLAVHALRHAGYPIRTSADQWVCAPPRGLSRLVASFLAWRLHRHPPWTYVCLAISFLPPYTRQSSGLWLKTYILHHSTAFLPYYAPLLPFSSLSKNRPYQGWYF